jgi:hypothetical protein
MEKNAPHRLSNDLSYGVAVKRTRPGEENGSNLLKYRWKPAYCQAAITYLEYEKIQIKAVKCR